MTFWIVAILLTLMALVMLVASFFAANKSSVSATQHDKAIYLSRLEEIDRDQELGRISAQEAEAAKTEEARRLIKLADQDQKTGTTRGGAKSALIILFVIIFVPLASVSIYSQFGQPEYPDQHLADRVTPQQEKRQIEQLLARAQTHLDANPDDAKGWQVVAPVYMKTGRYDDARNAYANLLRLQGENPQLLAELGEAMIYAAGGNITGEAKSRLDRAVELDPKNNKARFYLALGLQQQNRYEEAKAAWNALIDDNPERPDLAGVARRQLTLIEAEQNAPQDMAQGEEEGKAPGNPTAQQVEDAASMDAGSRTAMIEGMVAQLREKLKDDPTNKAGWMRLFKSYRVLGKRKETMSALVEARAAFANDPDFLQELTIIESQMNKGVRGAAGPVDENTGATK